MLENAIAAHPSTLYVVAAGNDGANADTSLGAFPCAMPEANVVCVGATDNRDQRASFSNYGATAVDLFAPGVSIVSTYNGSPTAYAVARRHLDGLTARRRRRRARAGRQPRRPRPGSCSYALLSSVDAKPALERARRHRRAPERERRGQRDPGRRAARRRRRPRRRRAARRADAARPRRRSCRRSRSRRPSPRSSTPVATATPAPVLLRRSPSPARCGPRASKLRVSFRSDAGRVRCASRSRARAPRPCSRTGPAAAAPAPTPFTLTRRLPTGKTLKPGSYTLAVVVSATAKSTRVIRVP